MIKEHSIGLTALCNGHYYQLDTLDTKIDGVFEIRCTRKDSNGITLLSPVIKNISNGEICFNKAYARVILPATQYEAYTQFTKWGDENRSHWAPINQRGIYLDHANGRTTEGNTPYIALREIGRPEGIAFHVLPFGDWRIKVSLMAYSNHEPKVKVELGISDEALAYRMQPGEEWELPEVIIHRFKDFELATGDLHRFLAANLSYPCKPMPIEYNTWLDTYSDLDVPHLREELKAASEIGCEIFVIDAGWFGGPGTTGWSAVGDWRECEDKSFLGKMKVFADEVRSYGLGFGIWTEPERFHAQAPVVKAHPEWFILVPNELNCYRIDLEQPEAYAYEKNILLSLIEKYGLRYMKTDMNSELGIDDSGAAHYRYAKLFYKIIDEIRELHPEFIIESCASGALRSDLESMKHFDISFPSDNGNPFLQTDQTIGFWRRFLPGQLMKWLVLRQVTNGKVPYFYSKAAPLITPKEATWEEFEQVDMESLLAINFTGGYYGFTGDIASLDADNRALAKKYITMFKEHRDFMRTSVGYCLQDTERFKALERSNGEDALLILQYVASDQVEERTVYPVDLNPKATYTYNEKEYTGAEIMENGLTIKLKYCFQQWKNRAEIIFLTHNE